MSQPQKKPAQKKLKLKVKVLDKKTATHGEADMCMGNPAVCNI